MGLFGQGGLAGVLADPRVMSLFGEQAKVPTPAPRQRGRGLFGGLRNAFDPSNVAAIQATLSGDYGAAAQIAQQRQLLRARQQQAEMEAEQERQAEAMRAAALSELGYSKQQINAMRPEEASRLVAERFQTRQFGPEGGSVRNVGPDGTPTFDRAPSDRTIGRSIIRTGPDGVPQTVYEGEEPVAVQQGGSVYGWTNRGPVGGQPAPEATTTPRTGPPPGAVVNGYRFRGGDPNDRNNWEAVGGAGGQAQTPFANPARYSRTAMAESGGRDFTPSGAPVRSPRGAMYAMQVMPDTAARPGFGVTPARGNSPAEFNRVGREYIDAMVREFGSEAAGAAAYNYGPARFRRLIARHPNDWRSRLPRETRDYLRRQGL